MPSTGQRAPASEVWQASFYEYLYSQDNLRSTAADYAFAADSQADLSVERGTMSGRWQNIQANGDRFMQTQLQKGELQVTAPQGAKIASA